MEELMDEFLDANEIYSFESESGLTNLETVFDALGYERHGYAHGELIEVFLADNPGACDALIDWIKEQNLVDWREKLEAALKRS